MEKKEMKFYEAPAMEVVEMEMSAPLLAGSGLGYGDATEDSEER